jgi:hypothetical protein
MYSSELYFNYVTCFILGPLFCIVILCFILMYIVIYIVKKSNTTLYNIVGSSVVKEDLKCVFA